MDSLHLRCNPNFCVALFVATQNGALFLLLISVRRGSGIWGAVQKKGRGVILSVAERAFDCALIRVLVCGSHEFLQRPHPHNVSAKDASNAGLCFPHELGLTACLPGNLVGEGFWFFRIPS